MTAYCDLHEKSGAKIKPRANYQSYL